MTTPVLADWRARVGPTQVARLTEARAETAATQHPSPAYLADLLQAEADSRHQRYVPSQGQMARLPLTCPRQGIG